MLGTRGLALKKWVWYFRHVFIQSYYHSSGSSKQLFHFSSLPAADVHMTPDFVAGLRAAICLLSLTLVHDLPIMSRRPAEHQEMARPRRQRLDARRCRGR